MQRIGRRWIPAAVRRDAKTGQRHPRPQGIIELAKNRQRQCRMRRRGAMLATTPRHQAQREPGVSFCCRITIGARHGEAV